MQLVKDMEKADKRRKIMFYLNPESGPAERYVCEEIDRISQGERGKVWRATLLAGFALRKQDGRLPHMLAELLTEDTTFEEMILVMQAVFPEEMKSFGERQPLSTRQVSKVLSGQGPSANVSQEQDETRANAQAMFGNTSASGKTPS